MLFDTLAGSVRTCSGQELEGLTSVLNVKNKRAPVFLEPVCFSVSCFELTRDYVGCTRSFFTLSDLEFHLLAFLKSGVAIRLDFRVMNEQILAAAIGCDKSKTFFPVKPFYYTCTHNCAPLASNGHKFCPSIFE